MRGGRLTRRALLVGLGAVALAPWLGARVGAASTRTSDYRVDISMLWGVLRYSLAGSMVEEIDPQSGRYQVVLTGTGTGITSRIEARGMRADGRYRPVELKSAHSLAGRDSSLSIAYDWDRRVVTYHSIGHTLLLGKRRQVDDVVHLPAGRVVDDAVSAGLNVASGQLDAAGTYRTNIIRRSRPPDEGPDDVTPGAYRVELVPFQLRITPEPGTGKLVAQVEMTGWSSWARPGQPAQVVFGPDRRIESIETRLQWGGTVRMELT